MMSATLTMTGARTGPTGLRVTGRFQAVNSADIRVIQRREDFGFALEPSEPVGISRERLRQDLERHIAVERGVSGLIHLAHPAFADLGGDLVDAEAGAGGQGHGAASILPLAGRGVQRAAQRAVQRGRNQERTRLRLTVVVG